MRRFIATLVLAFTLAPAALAGSPGGDGPQLSPCHYRAWGALPDRRCTPGATNPEVTQATIRQTICVPGWTRTQRENLHEQKLTSMHAYGLGSNTSTVEYDHLIPLELGGAPTNPKNLWPEPLHILRTQDQGAYTKDHVENYLRVQVCAGTLTLRAAQTRIARDWRKAER